MSDDNDDYQISDEEIDPKKHDKLVEEVLNLNKIQNVKKPSRTEPTLNVSEFNLVKSVTGDKGSVHLNALTSVLKGRKKHEKISNKVKSTSKRSKTLPVPLEKPQADRISRTLNYEKARLKFDKWEALVTSNRVAPQLIFPLNSVEKIKIEAREAEKYPSTWRIKSDLLKELESLEPKVEEYVIKEQEKKLPVSLKELEENRRLYAKLRAHRGFKEAKARQQNKIKSKKYHRILRKEKIKQKLQEFEELQKTDPEEALKKLEEIEKARAEERFSLRHKGTGQWARSKQIRAKYDKESRQVLAQQLAISRELTQKVKDVDSESENETSEEETFEVDKSLAQNGEQGDNDGMSGVKSSKEVIDFLSDYKKYWTEKNKTLQNPEEDNEEKRPKQPLSEEKHPKNCGEAAQITAVAKEKSIKEIKVKRTKKMKKTSESEGTQQIAKEKTSKKRAKVPDATAVAKKKSRKEIKGSGITKTKKTSPNKDHTVEGTSEWEVSLLEDGDDIEDIFDKLEAKLKDKVKNKAERVKNPKITKKIKKTSVKKSSGKKIDLTLPSKKKRPVIDEELLEQDTDINDAEDLTNKNVEVNELKRILEATEENKKISTNESKTVTKKTPTDLSTEKTDLWTLGDDNEEENVCEAAMMEAFGDSDAEEEFKKEKRDEIKKDTPKNIDLTLPGWGNWAGTGIVPRKRRKRFILRMPKKMPRKDSNKGALIINEKAQSNITPLKVSELPFPFKNVKDFEASIRAPIGSTFLPETSFRKLIEPSVITKMGAIIEPIDKTILMGVRK